jgi:hypothetical protein
MTGIKFTDRRGRKVELSKPHGAFGNTYYLTVNNRHYGQIVKVLGGVWVAYPNSKDLPSEYWDALIRWIEEAEGQQDKSAG